MNDTRDRRGKGYSRALEREHEQFTPESYSNGRAKDTGKCRLGDWLRG